jgi:hypothetical protein
VLWYNILYTCREGGREAAGHVTVAWLIRSIIVLYKEGDREAAGCVTGRVTVAWVCAKSVGHTSALVAGDRVLTPVWLTAGVDSGAF